MNGPCLVPQAAVAAAAGAAALTAARLGASPDAISDAVAAAVHSVWRWTSPCAPPRVGLAEECEPDHVGIWLADAGPDIGPGSCEGSCGRVNGVGASGIDATSGKDPCANVGSGLEDSGFSMMRSASSCGELRGAVDSGVDTISVIGFCADVDSGLEESSIVGAFGIDATSGKDPCVNEGSGFEDSGFSMMRSAGSFAELRGTEDSGVDTISVIGFCADVDSGLEESSISATSGRDSCGDESSGIEKPSILVTSDAGSCTDMGGFAGSGSDVTSSMCACVGADVQLEPGIGATNGEIFRTDGDDDLEAPGNNAKDAKESCAGMNGCSDVPRSRRGRRRKLRAPLSDASTTASESALRLGQHCEVMACDLPRPPEAPDLDGALEGADLVVALQDEQLKWSQYAQSALAGQPGILAILEARSLDIPAVVAKLCKQHGGNYTESEFTLSFLTAIANSA